MADRLDPQYRRDPVTGRWVIIAPVRSLRPITLLHSAPHARTGNGRQDCPLCEGSEQFTPSEIYAVRNPDSLPDTQGWQLRVVPNKYPAVHPITEPAFLSAGNGNLYDSLPGFGEHELVIECPDHVVTPTALTTLEMTRVLTAYRERIRGLARNPLYQYATIFKNVGAEAGASLAHLHSQIIATPMIPEAVRHELESTKAYYDWRGVCVFCEVIRKELQDRSRLVLESEHFLAICPFAPRFAYEIWILPRFHDSRYEAISTEHLEELANILRITLGKLDVVLSEPAYNYYLHTSPLRSDNLPHYHWHIEILPRVARQAGFEWGSGCFINAVLPEKAAADLRAAEVIADDLAFQL
jgi:UDPglucose--hexose-1-phosphate uridylyltransferase